MAARTSNLAACMQICSPAELRSFSFVPAEDILDDVSELAVSSPDGGPDDAPHRMLPSPGCHPEDLKSSVGSGQRVGRRMQILHNSSARMQMQNKGCTCRGRITVLGIQTNRTLSCTQTESGGFERQSHRSCCLKRLISCIVAYLPSLSVSSRLSPELRGKSGSLTALCV